MTYDPAKHHRRSIRLKNFDYTSAGAYFVTLCTKGRDRILHDPIIAGIITDVWCALPGWLPTIELDDVHSIIWLLAMDAVGTSPAPAPDRARASLAPTEWIIPQPNKINLCPSLGDVMDAFKSLVFTVYLDWVEAHDPARRAKFWQRNYYEHVIRSEPELAAIRRYIQENPRHWAEDRDNLDNLRHLPAPTNVDEYLEDVQALMNVTDET